MDHTTPPYDNSGILADDTLAPLKRNHACLQCKKRKVKCDATKPSCSPCLRSHAHAIRSAVRNHTTPPVLTCTYTETDSPPPELASQPQPQPQRISPSREEGSKRKRTENGIAPVPAPAPARVSGETSKTKSVERDDEKDALLARIADLERRLAGLTPPSDSTSYDDPSRRESQVNDMWRDSTSSTIPIPNTTTINDVPLPEPVFDDLGLGADLGIDDLFMVPKYWPKGLPSPFLLEHLIETFFNYVPVTPRMFHRASLLTRIKLPPTSPDFPFPGLLHAICATASSHTAWVNNLAPHQMEAAVNKHFTDNLDFFNIEDFGLAQAERAHKAVDLVTTVCVMGSGSLVLQVVQTCVLLAEVFFTKGFPLRGWMAAGQPARLIAVLEVTGRQARQSHKEPFLQPAKTDFEREERIATVWMAFMVDAGFSLNSNWFPAMNLMDIKCKLPGHGAHWQKMGPMRPSTQDVDSSDLFHSHPIDDPFQLSVKASILMSRAATWVRNWQQRVIIPGDELHGPQNLEFIKLSSDIQTYMQTVPSALKSIHRIIEAPSHTEFDADLLCIHLFPNTCLCIMHESFTRADPPNASNHVLRQACEAIMGVMHLIPSNLDVTLVFTPLTLFCLYTVGRIIAGFISDALTMQQFERSARWRADLVTLQNLLERYGQRHSLGASLRMFLENYIRLASQGARPTQRDMCETMSTQKTITCAGSMGQTMETAFAKDSATYYQTTSTTTAFDDIRLDNAMETLKTFYPDIETTDIWQTSQSVSYPGPVQSSNSNSDSAENTPGSSTHSNLRGYTGTSGSGSGSTNFTSPESDFSTSSQSLNSNHNQSEKRQNSSGSGNGGPVGVGPGQEQTLPWPAIVDIGHRSFFDEEISDASRNTTTMLGFFSGLEQRNENSGNANGNGNNDGMSFLQSQGYHPSIPGDMLGMPIPDQTQNINNHQQPMPVPMTMTMDFANMTWSNDGGV